MKFFCLLRMSSETFSSWFFEVIAYHIIDQNIFLLESLRSACFSSPNWEMATQRISFLESCILVKFRIKRINFPLTLYSLHRLSAWLFKWYFSYLSVEPIQRWLEFKWECVVIMIRGFTHGNNSNQYNGVICEYVYQEGNMYSRYREHWENTKNKLITLRNIEKH